GDGGDNELRHDDIEGMVGKGHLLRVHDDQAFDISQAETAHPCMRLTQHGLGEIDANKLGCARIIGKREAGSDADLQNASACALGRGNGHAPCMLENGPKNKIIDRRPARIGLRNRILLDLFPHYPPPARPPTSCADGPCVFLTAACCLRTSDLVPQRFPSRSLLPVVPAGRQREQRFYVPAATEITIPQHVTAITTSYGRFRREGAVSSVGAPLFAHSPAVL